MMVPARTHVAQHHDCVLLCKHLHADADAHDLSGQINVYKHLL